MGQFYRWQAQIMTYTGAGAQVELDTIVESLLACRTPCPNWVTDTCTQTGTKTLPL